MQKGQDEEQGEEHHQKLMVGADSWSQFYHWIIGAVNLFDDIM